MSDASAAAMAAPLLFGRYRVLEALGEGRLAAVYSATDERLQRRVLLHLLRKDLAGQEPLRRRFVEEANASAQRSHPALLEVFDSGEAGGRPFMVTEFAGGRPLRALGALTLEHALLYARQVAGAVAVCQAHRSPQSPIGLPHPPISSSNVLLIDEGRVKLVESWLTPASAVTLDLAHYRAPERTQGEPPTPATAVYALGLLLYELIVGARPISGGDARTVAQAHLTTRIPPLAQVRPLLYLPGLEQLLARATARAPEQRLPDAAAFGAALDALWRDLSAMTRPLPVAPVAPRRWSRDAAPPAPAYAPARLPDPAPAYPSAPLFQPAPLPDPGSAADTGSLQPVDRAALRRQNVARSLLGWMIMLVLLTGVGLGAYVAASYVVDQFFAIRWPQPTLPRLGDSLPDWIPGVETGELLVVNSSVGLYIRSQPSLDETTIITVVPNGALVRKLEGPVAASGVEWVRVRTDVDGKLVEGWMSLRYLTAR